MKDNVTINVKDRFLSFHQRRFEWSSVLCLMRAACRGKHFLLLFALLSQSVLVCAVGCYPFSTTNGDRMADLVGCPQGKTWKGGDNHQFRIWAFICARKKLRLSPKIAPPNDVDIEGNCWTVAKQIPKKLLKDNGQLVARAFELA